MIQVINGNSESGLFQLVYSNRLGEFDKVILCFDGKYVLPIQRDESNNLVDSSTNASNKVLFKQILFEKHWNEVESRKHQ